MKSRHAGRASAHARDLLARAIRAFRDGTDVTLIRNVCAALLVAAAGAATAQEVTGFDPHGGRGASVMIGGTGFTGAAAVEFNGVPAEFSVESDTAILATAPEEFGTGTISVDGTQSVFNFIERTGPVTTLGPFPASGLPLGVTASHSGAPNDGSISRAGGQTFNFHNIALSHRTWVYWGADAGGVRLSLNGNDFNSPPGEVMQYVPGESNPAAGRLVYRGVSALSLLAPWSPGAGVCTRFIMQFAPAAGAPPIRVVVPEEASLPSAIGALVAIAPGQDFSVNLRFEAAYQSQGCSTWIPALALYDAAPTNPTQQAVSSFTGGFYYENTAPEIGSIADQWVAAGGSTGELAFSLRDAETGDAGVVINGTSDNQTLVPDVKVVLGGSGEARTVAVTTEPGVSGAATITLVATDPAGATRTRSFTVATNDWPTISPIANIMVQYNQDSGEIPFTVGDTETAPEDLVVIAQSSNTVLVPEDNITLGGGGANRTIRVEPFLSQTGSSIISLIVRDEAGALASSSFVFRVNAPPMLTHNNPGSVAQGGDFTIDNSLLRATDAESGPAAIRFTLNPDGLGTVPYNGELRLAGVVLGDGSRFTQQDIDQGRVTYHNDDGCGLFDQFTFNVDDSEGGITPLPPLPTSFSFNIGVELRNDPPTASDGTLSVGLGSSASGQLGGSDGDCLEDDVLVFSIVAGSGPMKGAITALDSATGIYTYTATPGETGTDGFDFAVSDGTSSATAHITTEIENQPPVVQGTSVTTQQDSAVTGAVTATDPDLPPQVLTFAIHADPTRGSATIDAETGEFVYTPAAGRFGPDQFSVVASDGMATSAPATVNVSIRARMQAGTLVTVSEPLVHGDPASVIAVSPTTGDQAVIASDPLMGDLRGIAADAGGNIYVTDGNNGLLHVDAATGATNVISAISGFPVGVRLDPLGRLLVAEGPAGLAVFDVDGTELARYSGDLLEFATDVATGDDGMLYVTDAGVLAGGSSKIVRIDPATAGQVLLVGSDLDLPASAVFAADGRLLVGDGIPDMTGPGVLRIVDPDDGTMSTLSDPLIRGLSGLDVDAAGEVYAANNDARNVLRLPLDGSAIEVLSHDDKLGKLFGLAVVRRYEVGVSLDVPVGTIYDGTPKRAIASTIPMGLEALVELVYVPRAGGAPITCMATDAACGPAGAGIHDIAATLVGSADYYGSATGVLEIGRATGTVEWGPLSFVYDGNSPVVEATLIEEPSASCIVTGIVGPDVGSYPVHAACDGSNHQANSDEETEVTPQLAIITLSQLAQTYDGTPREVAVTTEPPGLPVSALYHGSPTPPTDAGTYAVTVTVTDANYSGSANATLVVAKAAGSVQWGPLSFPYTGSLPTVTATITQEPAVACTVTGNLAPDVGAYLAEASCTGTNHDANGNASVQVTPQPTDITLSGLVHTWDGSPKPITATTSPTTGVSLVVLYDGSPDAPSAVGEYSVLATVADPNYSGSASALLRIVAANVSDLSIAFVDPRDYAQLNRLHSYTLVVGNEGNTPVENASVSDMLPSAFNVSEARWTCFSLGEATCRAEGFGHLVDTIDIPASGGLVYVVTAPLVGDPADPTDMVINSASISAAGDGNPGNDSATTSARAVLFRDGLEIGGNGAWWPTTMGEPVALGALEGTNMLALEVQREALPPLQLATIARATRGSFAIEALRVGPSVWLRLISGYASSAWGELVNDRAMIALGGDGAVLLLVGTRPELEMPIEGAEPLHIEAPAR